MNVLFFILPILVLSGCNESQQIVLESDPQPEIGPEIPKPEPEIPKPEPEIPNPEPEIPKPEPEIPNPEPEIPKPEPEIPNPEPEIPNPEPEIPDPAPDFNIESNYSASSIHHVVLENTKVQQLDKISAKIKTIQLRGPNDVSDLSNMRIEDGFFVNNTSLEIKDFWVSIDQKIQSITLDTPIVPYSIGHLDDQLKNSKLLQYESLGSNTIAFDALVKPDAAPESRLLNHEERAAIKLMHYFEKYWINSPNALKEITARLKLFSTSRGMKSGADAQTSNSKLDVETNASRLYFAHTVSGQTSNIWVEETLTDHSEQPQLSQIYNTRQIANNLWLTSNEITQITDESPDIAIPAKTAFIHDYYHNLGFSHDSGWLTVEAETEEEKTGYKGMDDLVANVSQEMLVDNVSNKYQVSDIIYQEKQIDALTFEFSIYSTQNINDLNMRLLSSEILTASIFESGTNKFILKFDEAPNADVKISFYSDMSKQMSTYLFDAYLKINDQESLSELERYFTYLVNQHSKIKIKTADAKWVKDFYLPERALENTMIVFSSSASLNSTIHVGDTSYTLSLNEEKTFIFKNKTWEIIEPENK